MSRVSLHRLRVASSTCYAYNLGRMAAASLSFQSFFSILCVSACVIQRVVVTKEALTGHYLLCVATRWSLSASLPSLPDTSPGEITTNKVECGKKRQRGARYRREMSLRLRWKKSERVTKTALR